MRKYTKSLVALLLAIALLISSCTPIFAVGNYVVDVPAATSASTNPYPTTYSTTYNSGWRGQTCTALSAGALSYYTGSYSIDTLMSQSGSTLESTLRTLMRSITYTSSYDNCRDYADRTDCEGMTTSNSTRQITMLYTGAQVTYADYNSGNGWNREHVWPKSLGGDSTTGGGADLHHIRPDENKTNGDRGSLLYGETTGSNSIGNLSGEIGGIKGSYYEPNDDTKGDVARIILYVYVRWNSDWGATSITSVFQSVDVLLEWCALDPVDTWEMGRNEVIQNIQGNRNVFIDYPELAWKMFGKEVPSDMATPSNGGSTLDPSCQHTDTTVKNQVDATCGAEGYTGDTYCASCNGKISSGTVVEATGNHTYGDWVENNSTNTRTRTCSGCGRVETEGIACKHLTTNIRNKTDATCGAAGYTGDTYCVVCQVVLQYGETVDATGKHSYIDSWVLDKVNNVETRSCYVCGATQTKSAELESCAHETTDTRNAVAVTCGSDGYTGDVCCSRCDVVVEKGRKIFATGLHNFSETVIVTEPTIVEDGEGKQVCSSCYTEITVVIPSLDIEGEVTAEQLVSALGSDAEKILLLLALGMVDKTIINEITQ